MGCFIGCLGGEKDHKRRKRRTKPANPQVHRNKVQNVQQENVITAEENIKETPTNNLVPELQNKPAEDEQPSPSPKKRVTFNSNITIYEHVSVSESVNSLPEECSENENQDDFNTTSPSSHSPSDDDRSVISSVGSYPPNHRYHNARDSDDEYEECDDNDLDDFDDVLDEYDVCDKHDSISGQVSAESYLASSMGSRTGNLLINEEVESYRDESDCVNSVLKPIENNNQWEATKSKGTLFLKAKEYSTANSEAARVSFSQELTFGQDLFGLKSKSDRVKNKNREIGVDASLSNWLVCRQKNV